MQNYIIFELEQGCCVICNQFINEPICVGCLLEERIYIENTLQSFKDKKRVSKFIERAEFYEEKSICVICRKEGVLMCSSCLNLRLEKTTPIITVNKS